MTHEKFNKVVEETLEICKNTLMKKQDEYNLDEDRLSFLRPCDDRQWVEFFA